MENRYPIHIIQHRTEAGHALGTARIAELGLTRCDLSLYQPTALPPATNGSLLLVYPGDDSLPLTRQSIASACNTNDVDSADFTLLFLDASWRKSRRMLHESPELARLPRFHLLPAPSRYRIRREPHERAVSTLEAIVHALETLEAAPGRYDPLRKVMDDLIDEQIGHMGQEKYQRNYHDD